MGIIKNARQAWVGAAALLALCSSAQASSSASFLPENDLGKQDGLSIFSSSITAESFNRLIDQVEKYYAPIVAKHGAKLRIDRLWNDSKVNSYALQEGNLWVVQTFGGLARRPELTPDAFTLVLCHEFGHHLGGFPLRTPDGWAAIDGQADYYAAQSCAHAVWGKDTNANAEARASAEPITLKRCDAVWGDTAHRDLCYRTAAAAKALGELLAKIPPPEAAPDLAKKDPNVVTHTDTKHPGAQCRVDTMVAGSLCTVAFDPWVIPGKKGSSVWSNLESSGASNLDWPFDSNGNSSGSSSNALAWAEGPDAIEKIAYKYSCASGVGARPRCWFKPQVAGESGAGLFSF